ncbi:MAG: hypothetical protein COA44_02190 [Arcobacter sp.]|nr:MAG: hypothetical protein COA44_02190 [Arcobacter sp.]
MYINKRTHDWLKDRNFNVDELHSLKSRFEIEKTNSLDPDEPDIKVTTDFSFHDSDLEYDPNFEFAHLVDFLSLVDSDIYDELTDRCQATGESISQLTKNILTQYLKDNPIEKIPLTKGSSEEIKMAFNKEFGDDIHQELKQ